MPMSIDEIVEIALGDAHAAPKSVRFEFAAGNPAANRTDGDVYELRHLTDGEEADVVTATAAATNPTNREATRKLIRHARLHCED